MNIDCLGMTFDLEGLNKTFKHYLKAIDAAQIKIKDYEIPYLSDEKHSFDLDVLQKSLLPSIEYERDICERNIVMINKNFSLLFGGVHDYWFMSTKLYDENAYKYIVEFENDFFIENTLVEKGILHNSPNIHIEYLYRTIIASHLLDLIYDQLFEQQQIKMHHVLIYKEFYDAVVPPYEDVNEYKKSMSLVNNHKKKVKNVKKNATLKNDLLHAYQTRRHEYKNDTHFINSYIRQHDANMESGAEPLSEYTLKSWLRAFKKKIALRS